MPQRIPSHRTSPHAPAVSHREYDRTARDQESKRFYNSAAWKKVRRLKLSSSPLCEVCRPLGVFKPATHVHHKVELRDDPTLGLDVDNLQPLCHACHSRLHARQPTRPGG